MTERGDTTDTKVRTDPGTTAGTPEISEAEGAQAVAEAATDTVDPPPAGEAVAVPAPPLDEFATTPDRTDPKAALAGTVGERPELLVAGAFVGGLTLALVLRKLAQ